MRIFTFSFLGFLIVTQSVLAANKDVDPKQSRQIAIEYGLICGLYSGMQAISTPVHGYHGDSAREDQMYQIRVKMASTFRESLISHLPTFQLPYVREIVPEIIQGLEHLPTKAVEIQIYMHGLTQRLRDLCLFARDECRESDIPLKENSCSGALDKPKIN